MSKTAVTREQIENLINQINEIENARPTQPADKIVARLSALCAENIEVWVNGKHIAGRSGVDEVHRSLFNLVDDYHRDIQRIVIEPPFGSFAWRMGSVKNNLEMQGCSIIEVDQAGMNLRSWLYFDPEPFVKVGLF